MDLTLNLTRKRGNSIPVNYQYPLSSWIYKVISRADESYGDFLHQKGFSSDGKAFKMFTFSQLDVRPYTIEGNVIRLHGAEIKRSERSERMREVRERVCVYSEQRELSCVVAINR